MFLARARTRLPAALAAGAGLVGTGLVARADGAKHDGNWDGTPKGLEGSVMYAKQPGLPRLPLPSLDDTLARYLRTAEPLTTSAAQLAATRAAVTEALAPGSALRSLQAELERREVERRDASFVSAAWESMYLKGRWPLPINSNPGSVTRSTQYPPDVTTQVARAARSVAALTAFAQEVDAGTLAPDVLKGAPLDMRQYPLMFGATRLPRAGRDVLHKAPAERSGHIVVLRGSDFWVVPVVDERTRRPLSVAALEVMLQRVVDETPSAPPASAPPSLAVLTTVERDRWARVRAELEAHSDANRASLAALDDSLFHLCLDTVDLGTKDGAEPAEGAMLDAAERTALVGNPRTAPRWFDKACTYVFSADAVPLFTFEHSWGDGMPVLRCGLEVAARIRKGRYAAPADDEHCAPPRRLEWKVPPAVAAEVERCDAEFAATCEALDLQTLKFSAFGAPQLKEWGISPDAAVQAALALAFHRVTGHLGATYEAATTAYFAGGRTETARPTTSEASAFVHAAREGRPLVEQAAALHASAKRHTQVTGDAARGRGFDRHLFALKTLAEEGGAAAPSFFSDPTYTHLAGNELSTSTLTLPSVRQSIFGPVHPKGFGVMYSFPSKDLRFCATTWGPRGSAAKMTAEIEAALAHVGAVLEAGAKAKAEAEAKGALAEAKSNAKGGGGVNPPGARVGSGEVVVKKGGCCTVS